MPPKQADQSQGIGQFATWSMGLAAIAAIAAVVSIPALQPWIDGALGREAAPRPGPNPSTASGFVSGISEREYETAESGTSLLRKYLERHSISELQRHAEDGHPEALYLLGLSKLYGLGQAKDVEGAFPLLQRSWDAGFPRAGLALGVMYHWGSGVARDPQRAIQVWTAGADAGFAPAITMLGWTLAFGDIGHRDLQAARNHLERAAQSGNALAIAYLGDMHAFGAGFPRDEALAFASYQRAADAGSILGQSRTAEAYEFGLGTAVNLDRALELYLAAGRRGEGPAAVRASELLMSGQVRERSVVRATEILQAAIEYASSEAKARLAKLALLGEIRGFDEDTLRRLALEADADGFPEGLVALVANLQIGRHGMARDLAEAGRLARIGMDRAEARSLAAAGAWPIYRMQMAVALREALRERVLEERRPGELAHLERMYGRTWNVKKFVVSMRCGSRTLPMDIYVWDSTAPVAPVVSQFRWYEQARGCEIPQDVETSFTRLYEIAQRDNLSYANLTIDAMNAARQARGE